MSESLYIPLAVIGLTVLAVIMAGMYQRYEADQAIRRSVAKREIRLVQELENLLNQLNDAALSPDLRKMLRIEVVKRYSKVVDVFPKYPNLAASLLHAGEQMKAESKQQGSTAPTFDTPEAMAAYNQQINHLIGFLKESTLLHHPANEKKAQFITELGECRAKVTFNSYTRRAKASINNGDQFAARTMIGELSGILSHRGPDTPLVRDLYNNSVKIQESYANQKDNVEDSLNEDTPSL